MDLCSYTKYPVVKDAEILRPIDDNSLINMIKNGGGWQRFIPRGQGKSFGDCALAKRVICPERMHRILSFDKKNGIIAAEAGIMLREILEVTVPSGWFLTTTPGTGLISLGGAIGSDVHGKDHHINGSFCQSVLWFDLWTPAYGVIRCSAAEHEEIFRATAGGMGLTGVVLRAAIRLMKIRSVFIKQSIVKSGSLAETMDTFVKYGEKLPFSVAWMDVLKSGKEQGRSIFMGGRFAEPEELPTRYQREPLRLPRKLKLSVPFDLPSFTLNKYTVSAFNALYYGKFKKGLTENIVDYDTFFYPLDKIYNWNRIYGKAGFAEFQCVVPKDQARKTFSKILTTISAHGQGTFLTVFKLFGRQAHYPCNISFPMEGYTLNLDFKVNPGVFPLMDELDRYVMDAGGRTYLSKDCRLSKEVFWQEYRGNAEGFMEIRAKADPEGMLSSLQSRRIGLSV